jgi:hypothetical protein
MKLKILKFLTIFCLTLTLGLTTNLVYSQCAMCRATVESNVGTGSKEPESEVGSGLNTGILYLMIVPYILIGTVGFMWYRYSKKQKASS